MTDDERARALLQIIRTEHWNDEYLEAILLKALRAERGKVWEEAAKFTNEWTEPWFCSHTKKLCEQLAYEYRQKAQQAKEEG